MAANEAQSGRTCLGWLVNRRVGYFVAGAKPPLIADLPSVAGRVVDGVTGQPLAGAQVMLTGMPSTFPESVGQVKSSSGAFTDTDGRFEVRRVDPGRYDLQVFKTGYEPQGFPQRSPKSLRGTLSLPPGAALRDLVIRMAPNAKISGRVIEEDGKPPFRVFLKAVRPGFDTYGYRHFSGAGIAWTNERGEYEASVSAPGCYYLQLDYPTGLQVLPDYRAHWRPTAGGGEEAFPNRVYYPNSTTVTEASAIAVKAGEERRNVDFTLHRIPSFAVSGRIDNSGEHSRGASMVVLTPQIAVSDPDKPMLATISGPDGTFGIHGALPGFYELEATRFEGLSAKEFERILGKEPTGSATVPLKVENSNIANLRLRISPVQQKELTGRLVSEGQATGVAGFSSCI